MDVAIVGAGPAGAWTARQLATGGARVALLDGSHPREKPCGGGVTRRALELVEPAVALDLPSMRIAAARFEAHGNRATVTLEDGALVVASRRAFDAALIDAATHAGAAMVPYRVRQIQRTSDGWRLTAGDEAIEAEWLVGADGANSLVRRSVHRPFDREDLSIASGYFVHGASATEIDLAFEADLNGYLWAFPRPDHLAVGACAQANDAASPVLLAHAERWIARNVPVPAAQLERYSWPIPSLREASLRRERPAGERWLLAGDAAGLVDPITREGIFFALRSAHLASAILLRGQACADAYVRALHEEIYPELIRAERLKRMFFTPRFTALLVRALDRSARIRQVMADLISGKQPYRGLRRRLLRTFELRLMLESVVR